MLWLKFFFWYLPFRILPEKLGELIDRKLPAHIRKKLCPLMGHRYQGVWKDHYDAQGEWTAQTGVADTSKGCIYGCKSSLSSALT